MSDIHLLIPDAALREAIAEQISASRIGNPRPADTVQAVIKACEGQNPCVLVVSNTVYDKKNALLLQNLPQNPSILVVGDPEDGIDATESFPKPLRLGHLLTRLRYYLETAPLLRNSGVDLGSYRLEPQNRRIMVAKTGEMIRLTEKETALLLYLAQRQQPALRRDILADVWGYDENIDTHTLETHIYQLRRKLENVGENWLVNEAGAYRLARGTQQ